MTPICAILSDALDGLLPQDAARERGKRLFADMAAEAREKDVTLRSIAALPDPEPPLVVVDLETSGLTPATGGIVEIGAVLVRGGEIAAEWSSLCWPGRSRLGPANRKVLEISGITLEEVIDAPSIEEAVEAMEEWMKPHLEQRATVTSFNLQFDSAFLEWHSRVTLDHRGECLMRRAQAALGLSRYPSLARACEAFGIERDAEHRALADARAAALVHLAMERGT